MYSPGASKQAAAEAPRAPESRRALDTLQRRLNRATCAVTSANAQVAALETENARLVEIIKEKDKVIEAQAAVIVDLKSQCRALRQDLNQRLAGGGKAPRAAADARAAGRRQREAVT